ncbi:MAG: 6-bladed beta-propeller [Bacteroidales bacterium]|nr:6-bladed beta-propeller [Bacteroidales bacterium]
MKRLSFDMVILWMAMSLGLLCSCAGEKEVQIKDVESETVCRICGRDSEGLGRLNSLAIIDSEYFALSTDYQVYVYSMLGHQVRKIGRSGNAKYEYNLPLYVRSDGEQIYVWSAMSMKFIAYTMDGEPVVEYGYDSAVKDFCPSGKHIIIYPAGVRGDHLIDIYDKSGEKPVKGIAEASKAHKVLSGWLSVAPVACNGNIVNFLPLDRLELLEYNIAEDRLGSIATIKSDTFRPEKVKGEMEQKKALSYMHESPYALMMINRNGKKYILASEGRYEDSPDGLRADGRFCSIYEVTGHGGKKIYSFPMSSFGYSHLLSACDGYVYFIQHSIENNDDAYTLKRFAAAPCTL